MNEHRETRTPTFSENLDSTQVTVSKDTVNLDTDTLATTSLTSNVSTCTPTEPLVLLYERILQLSSTQWLSNLMKNAAYPSYRESN